jgi:hypothetical protein
MDKTKMYYYCTEAINENEVNEKFEVLRPD